MAPTNKQGGNQDVMALLDNLPSELVDKLRLLNNPEDAVKFAEAGMAKVLSDSTEAHNKLMDELREQARSALAATGTHLASVIEQIPANRDILVTVRVHAGGVEVQDAIHRIDGKKPRSGGRHAGGFSTAAITVIIGGTEYKSRRAACDALVGTDHKKHHCNLVLKSYAKLHHLQYQGLD